MEDNHDIKTFLAEHPKMMGALFTLVVLLSQIGTAAAQHGGTTIGP